MHCVVAQTFNELVILKCLLHARDSLHSSFKQSLPLEPVMILVVLALALAVGLNLVMYHRKRKHLVQLVNKFDGPPTLPLIGNIHYFLCSSKGLYFEKLI